MKNLSKKLSKALEKLIAGIQSYQSDTFDGCDLDKATVELIAAQLIYNHLFDENGTPNIDGVELSEILSWVTSEE